jgi:hypothetical protein
MKLLKQKKQRIIHPINDHISNKKNANRVNQQLAGPRSNFLNHIIAQNEGAVTVIVSYVDTQPKPSQ